MAEDRSYSSKLFRIVLPIATLGAGVGGLFALAALRRPPALEEDEILPPLVETIPVVAHTAGLDFEVDGLVVPFREISLAAEVDGRVSYKADVCRAGNYVTRDTLLIQVDRRDYEIEVQRLQKELEQAASSLEELDVEIDNTNRLIELAEQELALQEQALRRLENLHEDGVVSDSELDQARRSELIAQTAVLTLRNLLRLKQTSRTRLEKSRDRVAVQLEKAKLDLTRTEILAPVDGVVVEEFVQPDSYVKKGAAMISIEDTSSVEVKCNLRMDELYWLWGREGASAGSPEEDRVSADYQIPKTPVTVIYHLAGDDYLWDGELSRYDGIGLDETTRTVPCRAVVDDPRAVRVERVAENAGSPMAGPPALVRGMFVTVRVHASPEVSLVRIPERAVQPGDKVGVIRNNKLKILNVHVVEVRDSVALVLARNPSLIAGDKVVVSPLAFLEDGMTVREQSGQ